MDRREAEKTAARFGVTADEVEEHAAKIEEEKAVELELRAIKRDKELVEFLRHTYDREALTNKCEWGECNAGPWEYYDELIAHVRTHLIVSGSQQANAAMNAVDKLINPSTEIQAKAKLPPGETSEKLLDRVAEGLARRLSSKKLPPGDVVDITPDED